MFALSTSEQSLLGSGKARKPVSNHGEQSLVFFTKNRILKVTLFILFTFTFFDENLLLVWLLNGISFLLCGKGRVIYLYLFLRPLCKGSCLLPYLLRQYTLASLHPKQHLALFLLVLYWLLDYFQHHSSNAVILNLLNKLVKINENIFSLYTSCFFPLKFLYGQIFISPYNILL